MGRKITTVLMVLMMLAGAGFALAADNDNEIARVALWKIGRADWGNYVKHFEKWEKPVMEKLLADGTITEWGMLSSALHTEGGYTHASWFTTPDHGSASKVWKAYEAHIKKVGGSEGAAAAEMAKMEKGHRDMMLREMIIKGKPGTIEGGVYYQWSVQVQVDAGEKFDQFWKDSMQPVYEKLMADGVVLTYGFSTDEIVMDKPGSRSSWVVLKDLSGMDKMQAAFEADRKDWTKTQGNLWWSGIKDMIEMGSFREYMGELIHYGRGAAN